MGQKNPPSRNLRTRKLTRNVRIAICELYEFGTHTMTEIGIIFGVSQPRISQIVRDTYGEMKQIELERLYLESLELGE